MDLKILSWNVRGLNSQNHQTQLMDVISSNNVCVCGVLESHITAPNITKICNKVFRRWDWTSNMSFCPNWIRIIVGWDPQVVELIVVSKDDQVMHCLVKPQNGQQEFFCSFLYGHVKAPRRRPL
jgi:hypothetical protein